MPTIQIKGITFALKSEETCDGEDGQLLVWAELVNTAGQYVEHHKVATRHMEDCVEPNDFISVASALAHEIVDDIFEAQRSSADLFYVPKED